MAGQAEPLPEYKIVQVRRPSTEAVSEIHERLSETGDRVRRSALVGALRRETGCSRATAYRAVQDFLEERRVGRDLRETDPGAVPPRRRRLEVGLDPGPRHFRRTPARGPVRRSGHRGSPRWSTVIRSAFLLVLVATLPAASTLRRTTNPPAAYAMLLPVQQRIAEALFRAEGVPATRGDGTVPAPLSLDQIAELKASGQGWQQVFDQMRSAGLLREDNLRQVLSKYYHLTKGPTHAR
jgi:hypothetical protein